MVIQFLFYGRNSQIEETVVSVLRHHSNIYNFSPVCSVCSLTTEPNVVFTSEYVFLLKLISCFKITQH